MRNTPVAGAISMRTTVAHMAPKTVPKRLFSVGGYFTLERSRGAYVPPPLRTASASISALHVCPAIGKLARDHPQREKACAMAPVTSLRAWALAAIEGNDSGAKPGISRLPSFQRAASHCPAVGLLGAMPHRSSAAGHRPKRNMTRAASAAACVPTRAPFEAKVGVLIAGTQRGFFATASWVAWFMVRELPEVTSP